MERQSLAAGQDYLVVPVSKSAGIFHPKCIYLVGESEDVLLVDGNLTFGGHGKNVGSDYFTRRDNPEARKRRLIHDLKSMGYEVTIAPAA